MSDRESTFAGEDARAIVRLMNGVLSAGGGIRGKRRRLMEPLCDLLGADGWFWCLPAHGGELPADPDLPAILPDPAAPQDGKIHFHGDLHTGSGRPLMASWKWLAGDRPSAIGIYRREGAPHFSRRECRIADVILTEVPWLYAEEIPGGGGMKADPLNRRQREVLEHLRQGWSRKRIAAHLGLSIYTVHSYTKVILRHFGVHSRSELLARTGKGDPAGG